MSTNLASLRCIDGDLSRARPSPRRRAAAMVGGSRAMNAVRALIEQSASTDATILIEGESGTGKELAARALHERSARADRPFVVVDCSSLPAALLDSHLFGHVRGAFTGADRDRRGAFVEASGGTLFLDEIGELPLAAQTRLLRALEARTVQPVGADRPIDVDTRVVAATHRDLSRMVADQTFRLDLYYRLAIVRVALPPLRERRDDLGELVAAFYAARGLDPGPIDGDNLTRLAAHAWPGNVRELRNVLERAWVMSGPTARFGALHLAIDGAADVPGARDAVDTSVPFKDAKERWSDQFERRYLIEVFEACRRNITHAAAHAGINRRHFRKLLHKHGLVNQGSAAKPA